MYEFENKEYSDSRYARDDQDEKQQSYWVAGLQEEPSPFSTNPAQGESHV